MDDTSLLLQITNHLTNGIESAAGRRLVDDIIDDGIVAAEHLLVKMNDQAVPLEGIAVANNAAGFKWGRRRRQRKPGVQQRKDGRRFSGGGELRYPGRECFRWKGA